MSNNDQFDDLDDLGDFDDNEDGGIDSSFDAEVEDGDWDQYDDGTEDVAGEVPEVPEGKQKTKKKSGLFNLLLIGGAVLAAGGFIFIKMGAAPPPSTPLASEVAAQQNPAPPKVTIETEIAKAPSAPVPSVLPMPTPIAASESTAPVDSSQLLPAGPDQTQDEATFRLPKAGDILLKKPTVESESDSLENDSKQSIAIISETTVQAPAVNIAPVISTSLSPETGAVPAESIEKINVLSTRVKNLETQLENYRQENVTKETALSESAKEISALQKTISTLQARLDEKGKQDSAVSSQKMPDRVIVQKVTPEVKPRPQILGKKSDPDLPAPAQAQAPSSPYAPESGWVLKGAQPGRAMVAKAGERDLHPVVVGDTLLGIGRVTAIMYQDGKWQVIGTEGKVSQ